MNKDQQQKSSIDKVSNVVMRMLGRLDGDLVTGTDADRKVVHGLVKQGEAVSSLSKRMVEIQELKLRAKQLVKGGFVDSIPDGLKDSE